MPAGSTWGYEAGGDQCTEVESVLRPKHEAGWLDVRLRRMLNVSNAWKRQRRRNIFYATRALLSLVQTKQNTVVFKPHLIISCIRQRK